MKKDNIEADSVRSLTNPSADTPVSRPRIHDYNGLSEPLSTVNGTVISHLQILEAAPGFNLVVDRRNIKHERYQHEGNSYVVFNDRGELRAIRTDVRLDRVTSPAFDFRRVDLLGSPPSRGWHVWSWDDPGWSPIPGQHLQSRTAPAKAWLVEFEGTILPALRKEGVCLIGQIRQRAKTLGLPLRHEQGMWDSDRILSKAQDLVLNCSVEEVRLHDEAALEQYRTAMQKLDDHVTAGRRRGASRFLPWIAIPHRRVTHQLQTRVDDAKQVHKEARESYSEVLGTLQERDPYTDNAINQKIIEIETFYVMKRDAKRLSCNIKEAQELITHLRSRQGLITFDQTLIREHRLLDLPRLSGEDVNMKPLRVSPKMRI